MDIIAFPVLLVFFMLSLFFSGMETGMISIDRFRLEQEVKSDKHNHKIKLFLDNPNAFLGITLIGNNIAIVVVSSLFAIYFADKIPYLSRSVSTLALAGMMLIFAEIIPKSYCRDNAEQLVRRYFYLLYLFYLLMRPFVGIINSISRLLANLFKIDTDNRYSFLSREDLAIILAESSFDESIEKPQRDMLEEVMEFNELTAKNVMTPRLDIVAIRSDTPIQEVIKIARDESYTRYPVYKDNVDEIIGIMIIYDLIGEDPENGKTAQDYAREALFVPETIDINSLLKEMQKSRKSMAIVVDSYGGTSGLITTEDIIEELVGEIEDEYDSPNDEDVKVKVISSKSMAVRGDVEIDFLNDNYDVSLPEGEYETIAGLIIKKIMKVPAKGQKITIAGWKIEVTQATPTKILKVLMTKEK